MGTVAFNALSRGEPSMIYLAKPGKKLVCALNGVLPDSVSIRINGQNTHELSFTVADTAFGESSNGYNYLDEMMLLFCDGIWFKINEPPEIEFDGEYERKTVKAESLEIELLQYDIVGFEVNTGSAGSAEMMLEDNVYINADGAKLPRDNVKFCNKENEGLSLLHLILKHGNVPNWNVGYVDELELSDDDVTKTDLVKFLSDKVSMFSVDSKTVYSFLTQDVANEFRCIFQFDTENYLINAYAVEHLGKDTNVFINYRNLRNSFMASRDEDLYTAFAVEGDDDVQILYANFGENIIYDISYFLNTKYLDQAVIDKYSIWNDYRESKRQEYIDLSKQYNTFLNTLSELKDRVPIDDCQTDWTTFDDDDLLSTKEYYISVINAIYTSYGYAAEFTDDDGNPTTHTDEDGFVILKSEYIGDDTKATELSDIMCNGALKTKMLEDNCWHSYFQYRYNIYATIMIEFENRTIADEDKKIDYIDAWETDWDLFGIDELKAKLVSYQERVSLLQKNGYGDDYVEDSTVEGDYGAEQHKSYLEFIEKEKGCQAALDERQAEYDTEKAKQDVIQGTRNALVSDVAITNPAFGFTDEEINIVQSLYNKTDYKNENFYISQYATPDEEIDEQYRLYLDAKDALYARSHPQYTYRDSIDNLYALPEFQTFQKQLNIYDFIYVEIQNNHYEKLRVISISYNPCMLEDDLEIEFSSMIQYATKRNDYAQLLDKQNRDTKNQILGITGSKNDLEYNIDASVIKMILNNTGFNTAITGATQESINIASGKAESFFAKEFTSDSIVTKIFQAETGRIDELSSLLVTSDKVVTHVLESDIIKAQTIDIIEGRFQSLAAEYLDADYITSKVVISDIGIFNELYGDVANIRYLLAGNIETDNLTTIHLTASNAIIDDALINSAVIGKLSVADLVSHSSSSELITLISSDGNPTIAFQNSTQQFYDSDGNVRVQIGQDASGEFNFIVRGADGVTAMYTQNGVTRDAIADGLIINDMIQANTIDKDRLNFPIIEPNEYGGLDVTQIYDGTGGQWGVEIERTVGELDTKIEESLVYNVEIWSSNGDKFKNGEISTVLSCHVFKSNQEITDTLNAAAFHWTKINNDGTPDEDWNTAHFGGTKEITITEEDVYGRSTFNCNVDGIPPVAS